jgi:hypothetical protein
MVAAKLRLATVRQLPIPVNISDRPWGEKLGAPRTRLSFRLLRAGFEPFRACANPTSYYLDVRFVYSRGGVRTALRWHVHGAAQNRRETV